MRVPVAAGPALPEVLTANVRAGIEPLVASFRAVKREVNLMVFSDALSSCRARSEYLV